METAFTNPHQNRYCHNHNKVSDLMCASVCVRVCRVFECVCVCTVRVFVSVNILDVCLCPPVSTFGSVYLGSCFVTSLCLVITHCPCEYLVCFQIGRAHV